MADVRRTAIIWLPLLAWMAVILHFSLVAEIPAPPGTDISYLHVPAYFILSALFLRLFLKQDTKRGFLLAIILSTSYGIAMEVVQPFIQGRMFSVLDIALDFAGSCLILALLPERCANLVRALSRY